MLANVLIAAVIAATAPGISTPAAVAMRVLQAAPDVSDAINAADPLTRAAAARVVAARNLQVALPALREAFAVETDAVAMREQIRALAMSSDADGVRLLVETLRAKTRDHDDVLASAIARRDDAIDLYIKLLQPAGIKPNRSFFKQALWQRSDWAVATGSRLLGLRDHAGWQSLLQAFDDSHLRMAAPVMSVSLNIADEEIRNASVWQLVHHFAVQQHGFDELIGGALDAPAETASVREEFGRELLSRMRGRDPHRDPRWMQWLQSAEADDWVGRGVEIFVYFTEDEFVTRKKYCDLNGSTCGMPMAKSGTIPSKAAPVPPFIVPDVLPRGLADAVVKTTRCRSERWLAVAAARVDRAGRVVDTGIQKVAMSATCESAMTALIRLSLITPPSMTAPLVAGDNILVHEGRTDVCLDESLTGSSEALRLGGSVTAPIVKHRVEPYFPENVRRKMPPHASVQIIVEAVISREGCIRAAHLVTQSPYGDLNAAALLALSQWRFDPGRLDGVPVEVIFDLTVMYRLN